MARVMDMPPEISVLHADPWTAPFWAAARSHRLVAARCGACRAWRPMPPGPFCWDCQSTAATWVELSGTGMVHTYTVVRGGVMDSLMALAPFVIAVVDLDGADGVRLMSNVLGIEPDAVRIGLPVTVVWDDVDADTTFPRFRPS